MTEQGQANHATKITIGISVAVLLAIAGYYAWNHLYLLPKARKVAADTMRDPGSVQFRNEALLSEPQGACGELNAKNGLGAYTGFTRYIAMTAGNYAIEGGPVIGWRGYDETDRLWAALTAQQEFAKGARARRAALEQVQGLAADQLESIPLTIDATEAQKIADMDKFKALWKSLCEQ